MISRIDTTPFVAATPKINPSTKSSRIAMMKVIEPKSTIDHFFLKADRRVVFKRPVGHFFRNIFSGIFLNHPTFH